MAIWLYHGFLISQQNAFYTAGVQLFEQVFHEKYEVIIARNHPNICKTGVPFGTGLGMKFWTNSGCGTENFTVNDNLTKMTKNSWWWTLHEIHAVKHTLQTTKVHYISSETGTCCVWKERILLIPTVVFKHYLHTQQAILILLFWNDKVYAFIAYRPHFLGSLKRPPYGHIRSPKQLRWSCHFRLIGLTPLSLM